jgi:hypothetical protein
MKYDTVINNCNCIRNLQLSQSLNSQVLTVLLLENSRSKQHTHKQTNTHTQNGKNTNISSMLVTGKSKLMPASSSFSTAYRLMSSMHTCLPRAESLKQNLSKSMAQIGSNLVRSYSSRTKCTTTTTEIAERNSSSLLPCHNIKHTIAETHQHHINCKQLRISQSTLL